MTISGSGYSPQSQVTIGSANCLITSQTFTSIVCTLPAQGAGSYSVTVTANGKTATSSNQITYDAASTPAVTGVDTLRGGTGGGVSITITGTYFPTNPANARVSIDRATCDVTASSATSITCTTGSYPYSSKKALIQVFNSEIGYASNVNTFFSANFLDMLILLI